MYYNFSTYPNISSLSRSEIIEFLPRTGSRSHWCRCCKRFYREIKKRFRDRPDICRIFGALYIYFRRAYKHAKENNDSPFGEYLKEYHDDIYAHAARLLKDHPDLLEEFLKDHPEPVPLIDRIVEPGPIIDYEKLGNCNFEKVSTKSAKLESNK